MSKNLPQELLTDGYGLPVVGSLLLHGFILLLLFVNWQLQSKTETVQTPPYIKAELVALNAQAAPPRPQAAAKPVAAPDPEPEPEPVLEPEPAPAPEPDIQRLHQLEQEKVEKKKQEKLKAEKQKQEKLKKEQQQAEKKKKEAAEKKKAEEAERAAKEKAAKEKAAAEKAAAEKRKADEALSQAMAEEDSLRQSLSDQKLAQSYADMIRRRVEENWSRPPSAKKGMEVLLEIQLVPTGYVTGVSVLKCSGNPSFDLSAQQAVHKAERFPEIKDVPPRVFEEHFRRFKMLFRVEDNL